MSIEIPSDSYRQLIPFKTVQLHLLDINHRHISTASGFIRRVGLELFLYTCWHAITGYKLNPLEFKDLPTRRYIRVRMKSSVDAEGYMQGPETDLALYESPNDARYPKWEQDDHHIPNADLNPRGLFVPFWHDAVRIKMPDDFRPADLQVFEEADFPDNQLISVAEKVLVCGFPYGYSATGQNNLLPVVLSRHVAATQVGNRRQNILLDGIGAEAMSGGPVFIDRGDKIRLLGVYTGTIYPDHEINQQTPHTQLGTCTDLSIHLAGHLPFVREPASAHEGPIPGAY